MLVVRSIEGSGFDSFLTIHMYFVICIEGFNCKYHFYISNLRLWVATYLYLVSLKVLGRSHIPILESWSCLKICIVSIFCNALINDMTR